MKDKAQNAVKWAEINNWIPIIITAVTVAWTFSLLKSDLRALSTEVKSISEQQKTMIDLFKSVETRYGEMALDVKELQTVQGLN